MKSAGSKPATYDRKLLHYAVIANRATDERNAREFDERRRRCASGCERRDSQLPALATEGRRDAQEVDVDPCPKSGPCGHGRYISMPIGFIGKLSSAAIVDPRTRRHRSVSDGGGVTELPLFAVRDCPFRRLTEQS
jgi:hypothetical protein